MALQFVILNSFEKVIGSVIVNGTDSYPPGRVTDLQIVSMDANNMTVGIRFTAPGANVDYGTGKSHFKF